MQFLQGTLPEATEHSLTEVSMQPGGLRIKRTTTTGSTDSYILTVRISLTILQAKAHLGHLSAA